MDRVTARPPDSVNELCLIRLGLIVRKLSAWPFVVRIGRAIDRSAAEAIESGSGLLRSERALAGWRHVAIWQYWRDHSALDAWSHRPPHSDWWRAALDRMRTRGDLGIYHETYLVPRAGIESIYLDCPPIGLGSFGIRGEAVGAATTSRDRLGRRGQEA